MVEAGKSTATIVYVVDDEAAVARTIARTMRSGGFDPRTFGSPAEFLDALEDLEPGLVCLDVKMPEMSGIELLKILSKKRPEWPVIMLTGHAEVGSTIEAFRSGAIHFLRKPFQKKMLLEALEEAAEVARSRQNRRMDEKQLAALQRLTSREREILDEIAAGLHSKEIAWKLGISIRTVDVHRSNILSKLSAKNTSQAVAIARAAATSARDG
ncbi:MAG: response regulator [Sphingomonas sp.]|nr:response regulator [Sphingomonas sp.]